MAHVSLRTLLIVALGASALSVTIAQAQEPLEVVTSFSILDDMVETVGGNHVAVTTLVGPDGDVHAFSPRPADAQSLADADLIVVNGLQLEGWIDRLIDASEYDGDVLVASDGIKLRPLERHGGEEEQGHDHGDVDPHAWQDLENGEQYARNICDALVKVDPDHADAYRANARQYIEKMEALDAETRQRLAQIPESDRLIITSHDAFGYFADAYGLKLLSPVGINTLAEPSASDMGELTKQIESSHAKALFLENMTNPGLINQLHEETGIAVGGTLYADALTPDGKGSSYLGMFQHNVDTLIEALTTGD